MQPDLDAAPDQGTDRKLTQPLPAVSHAVSAGIAVLLVPLLIACRLLTLARVIRVGARMNDDLAGTV